VRPIVIDRVAGSVGLSVCRSVTLVSPTKTAAQIERPFGLRTRVGTGNHVLDGSPCIRSPMGRGNFEGGKGRPIVKYRDTLWTFEPIEMPPGLWARMGHRNNVLDAGPEVLMDVAMATSFGTQFAITGFVGYNFDCMDWLPFLPQSVSSQLWSTPEGSKPATDRSSATQACTIKPFWATACKTVCLMLSDRCLSCL